MGNPHNAALCRHFSAGKRGPAVAAPADVVDPYYTLGTHPDLVARLWDELGGALPVDCRSVFYGTPALIRSDTGTVFAYARGTHNYALRLPSPECEEAMRKGAAPAMEALGPEWVAGGWREDEAGWCLAAYRFAGATD